MAIPDSSVIEKRIRDLDPNMVSGVHSSPGEDAEGDPIVRLWVVLSSDNDCLEERDHLRRQIYDIFRDMGSTAWVHVRFLQQAEEAVIPSGNDVAPH